MAATTNKTRMLLTIIIIIASSYKYSGDVLVSWNVLSLQYDDVSAQNVQNVTNTSLNQYEAAINDTPTTTEIPMNIEANITNTSPTHDTSTVINEIQSSIPTVKKIDIEIDFNVSLTVPLLRKNPNAILYIKTFKTGSSTLASLFHNYAVLHNKSVQTGNGQSWNGNKEYDMWVNHIYFTPKVYSLVPSAQKQVISIVRNPLQRWLSAWNFLKDRDESKHRKVLVNMNVTQYINQHKTQYQFDHADKDCIAFNTMCKSLIPDYAWNGGNDTYNNWPNILNGNWLILVTDYWNESMLLLKHAYNLTWTDLVYLYMKKSKHHLQMSDLSNEDINKINELSFCDWKLYNISLKIFNKRLYEIYEGDEERMQNDIDSMVKIKDKKIKECNDVNKNTYDFKHYDKNATNVTKLWCKSITLDNEAWRPWAKKVTGATTTIRRHISKKRKHSIFPSYNKSIKHRIKNHVYKYTQNL